MKIGLEVTVAAINWPVVILKPSSLLVFVVAFVVGLKPLFFTLEPPAAGAAVLVSRSIDTDGKCIQVVLEAYVHRSGGKLYYYLIKF